MPIMVVPVSSWFAGSSDKGLGLELAMPGRRDRFATAASGADGDDPAFDRPITDRWVAWRAWSPVRASGGVRRTGIRRPNKQGQSEWCHYTSPGPSGGVLQEWWIPPLLVPNADVALVQRGGR